MEYRKLGRTDIEVSAIGLGTMTFGLQNTEQEGHEQMDLALDHGVQFFDTAELYAVPPSKKTFGATEAIIGSWLHKRQNRSRIVLASKITGPGPGWIRGGKNRIDTKNLTLALEGSLGRLQTDYIDLYQLHWPNRGSYHFQRHWQFRPDFSYQEVEDDMIETLQCLESFMRQGKVRAIGLSNETAWGTMKFLQLSDKLGLPRVASIQNEYSLLCRLFEPDLHEIAMAEDCGLLAWSPLSRGILSGKYLGGQNPPGSRLTIDPRPDTRRTPSAEAATQAYITLAQQHRMDSCQMALAFTLCRPFVTSTLVGATSTQQLKNNLDSIHRPLTNEVLSAIESIYKQYPVPY